MTDQRMRLAALLGNFPPVQFSLKNRQILPSQPNAHVEQWELVTATGQTVRAFFSRPAYAQDNLPVILYSHAHGNAYNIGAVELLEGRKSLCQPPYAQALAQAGIAALCIDLPCFGNRRHETESALAKYYLWHGQTLFGAMLAELSGVLTLMAKIPEIDASRIGALGLSMGATLSFWLGAMDTRVKAAAHLCCFADLETLVAAGAHDLHGIYMSVPGLLCEMRTGEIAGLLAPRPQLACMGLTDPLTPEVAVQRGLDDLRTAYAQSPGALEIMLSKDTGHTETADMRAAVLDFFRRAL